jgi:Phage integrase, N-terminal SAM-like domain
MANIERRVRDGRVRWYARHYDPSGNRHTKVFDTKAEADRFLTSVEMSKITGSYVDPNRSKVTVGVLADQWLEAKLGLAPKTRDRYEGIIRAHVRPRWGKVRLSDVTHAEVQRWLARLDLAPATVRKVHRVLSMIMA